MRRGGRTLVILGIVLALISGAAVFVVLATAEPQPVEVPTTRVIFAFQQIPERTEVTADQIGQVEWPLRIPTPIGAFAEPNEAIGKLARVPIYPGQPLVEQTLIDKSQLKENKSNAALILEPGMVAVAFGVNVTSSVAGAIQAGDRVDLLVTLAAEQASATGSAGYFATQTTLQNVLILQVGAWPQGEGEESTKNASAAVVTVQLTEQDALALQHIDQTAANYSLALRAANDDQVFSNEPVTLEYINRRFNFNIPGSGQ